MYLPHQCDAWRIAGEDFSGVTHAEALAELGRFIAEAQVVYDKLAVGVETTGDGHDRHDL